MKKVISVFAVLMMALLLSQCSGDRPQALTGDMNRYLSMMPDQAGLAYMNVASLRDTDFYREFTDSMDIHMENRELREIMEATGFDIRRDINEIYISFAASEQRRNASALVVVVGKYDPDKIMDYIKDKDEEHRLASEDHNGFTIYSGDNHRNEGVFSFADNNHIVAGNEAQVKQWLDNFKSGNGNSANSDRVKAIKYKNGMWVSLDADEMVDEIMDEFGKNMPMNRMGALEKIEKLNLSMHVKKDIRMDGSGIFADAENAELFHDALKGMLATVKLAVSQDRDAVDVINKIEISTKGNQVRIDASLSRQDIEKLKQRSNSMALGY